MTKTTCSLFLPQRDATALEKRLNRRIKTLISLSVSALLLLGILVAGLLIDNTMLGTDFAHKNASPSMTFLFGTDWLGRSMLLRTLKGLSISLIVGLFAAAFSTLLAIITGIAAATLGRKVDSLIGWLVDLFMGIPHLILLMLVCIMLGKGAQGVILGVAVTHWPSLCRVIRAEVMQLRQTQYILAARKMGRSRLWIAIHHMLPHLFPQFLVGLILMFPHAILHEASITFLGFGLSPHQPAIGIILSESMSYLSSGQWWLAFFPGLTLVILVRLFDALGQNIRLLIDPQYAND